MDFKQLIFVTGKGGTGKTTLGLFLARNLAAQGKKTLFVELTGRSSAAALLEQKEKPTYRPRSTAFGFDWACLQGVDCLTEYIGTFTKVESLTRGFFNNPVIRSLLNVAPGLNDLAILGKLTSHIRSHGPGFDYDHVIIDSHSTGSFSSLLAAPVWLGNTVASGPLHKQSQEIHKVLMNPSYAQFFFVSLFEELPVNELAETLNSFSHINPEQLNVIMNQYWDFAEVKISNPQWRAHAVNRLKQQTKQTSRVRELCKNVFRFDFYTDSLAETLVHPTKGELCSL